MMLRELRTAFVDRDRGEYGKFDWLGTGACASAVGKAVPAPRGAAPKSGRAGQWLVSRADIVFARAASRSRSSPFGRATTGMPQPVSANERPDVRLGAVREVHGP